MRRRSLAALAVLATFLSSLPARPAPASSAAGASPEPLVTRASLANGLRVMILENHVAPVVHVAVRYRYGTDDEPVGRDGLAHALEHMMFRGTRTLSGSGADELRGRLGFDANAETDREETHFYQTLPAEYLGPALRLEADRMRGLTLRSEDWASERNAVLEEIRDASASEHGVLEDAVRARAYPGTSFGHGGAGTPAGMAATTAADLRRAYATAYAPDNAVLVVAGDVRTGAAMQLVREVFGPVQGRARVTHPGQPAPRRGFTVRVASASATRVDVALASHGNAAPDVLDETIAYQLLAAGHSPLDDRLVRDGPCTSYVFHDDSEERGGLYHLVCTLDPGRRVADAVHAVRTALLDLADHPPRRAFAATRRNLVGDMAYLYDDPAAEADTFGQVYSLENDDARLSERDVAHATDARVVAVLRRWSTPVGIGIATESPDSVDRGATGTTDRRVKAEPAPRPHDESPIVLPAWARVALNRGLRLRDAPPIAAFALPNGVRVFVDRRGRSGTAYVRAGIDDPDAFAGRLGRAARYALEAGTPRWPRERIAGLEETRGITVTFKPDAALRGRARDLPTMLDIVADAWRTRRSFRSPDVRSFFAATARPDRFWIAIAGDVDAESAREIVAREFGGWRAPDAPLRPLATPVPRAAPSPGIERFGAPRPAIRVLMMHPAPHLTDPDSDATSLLDAAFGGDGAFDTRLVRELRLRRGLAYDVSSGYGDGFAGVQFQCAPRDLRAARAAVYRVFDGIRTHPPAARELERARRHVVFAAVIAAASPDGRLDQLAYARNHGVPADPSDLLRRLSAVTPADVARVARTYFRRDRIVEYDVGGGD